MGWSCSRHEIDAGSVNWVVVAGEVAEQLNNEANEPCPLCVQEKLRELDLLKRDDSIFSLAMSVHRLMDQDGVRGQDLSERVQKLLDLGAATAKLLETWQSEDRMDNLLPRLLKDMEVIERMFVAAYR